ncbi:phosphatase PAP2 family protein [Dictyobacter arantiisoli]|uniref:Undecaprenyl-diphosphatase n=1 Tax=Dictyobacter arantiisoli TaxID=2014874 RepID=A0A5A5TJX5_9CHLR|nr:phosphatase PAP2 family protein [Dictyobacter arantiisoli]GCF11323.1 undecaprenyl-diphosphatase [Dictyobacter arantiisoli]
MFSLFTKINYALFVDLNGHAGSITWLDAIMIFLANDLVFCLPILLLLAWGIPLPWRKHSLSSERIQLLQERRSAVIWTIIACLFSYALNLTVEQFIYEPRPFISHHVHLLVSHAADGSFPSDHTAWAFAVFGMLLLSVFSWLWSARSTQMAGEKRVFNRIPRFYLCLLAMTFCAACLVGIARIFVGVHYPDDIIGGALSGLIAATISTALRRWLQVPTAWIIQLFHRLQLA